MQLTPNYMDKTRPTRWAIFGSMQRTGADFEIVTTGHDVDDAAIDGCEPVQCVIYVLWDEWVVGIAHRRLHAISPPEELHLVREKGLHFIFFNLMNYKRPFHQPNEVHGPSNTNGTTGKVCLWRQPFRNHFLYHCTDCRPMSIRNCAPRDERRPDRNCNVICMKTARLSILFILNLIAMVRCELIR